ncbi:cytochrome P450 [Zopfochytrium polystomum]|nr:cytochrome P450 [Zopfochytrium polystomum]
MTTTTAGRLRSSAAALRTAWRILASSPAFVRATAVVAAFLAYLHYRSVRMLVKGLPSLPVSPVVGHLPALLRFAAVKYDRQIEVARRLGPTWTLSVPNLFGLKAFVATVDPLIVEHVLKTNFEAYNKGATLKEGMRPLLGHGIFSEDGDVWYRQRKISSQIFTARNFRESMSSVISQETGRLLDVLQQIAASGSEADLHLLFHAFTLDSFAKFGFGSTLGCLDNPHAPYPFAAAFDRVMTLLTSGIVIPGIDIIRRITGSQREIDGLVGKINDFAYDQIRKRRQGEHADRPRKDLLDLFMGFRDADGKGMTDVELRDMLLNMIIAGRDTTAVALSWAFYLISSRPDVVAEMRREIADVLSNKVPTLEQIPELKYITAVFYETLRLYPSVPFEQKVSTVADVLPGNISIPANTSVSWSLYAMGRYKPLWGPDAESFVPERWLTADDAAGRRSLKRESPFKWAVFNAGPRTCLGQQMATIEAVTVLAAVVSRFDVELVAPEEVHYAISLTLTMKNGMRVRVKKCRT